MFPKFFSSVNIFLPGWFSRFDFYSYTLHASEHPNLKNITGINQFWRPSKYPLSISISRDISFKVEKAFKKKGSIGVDCGDKL